MHGQGVAERERWSRVGEGGEGKGGEGGMQAGEGERVKCGTKLHYALHYYHVQDHTITDSTIECEEIYPFPHRCLPAFGHEAHRPTFFAEGLYLHLASKSDTSQGWS